MSSNLTIYTASAGSGKTFTLAAKYTAFLLSGENMGHARLLAVTFTNKATGEMKERIMQYLYDIAHGTDDQDDFLKAVIANLDDNTAQLGIKLLRERAKERLSELVHDYDHFYVQTIDSFFQSLLSNLAHELGLAANFRIDINDEEVISKAVDNIMKRIAALSETDRDISPEQVHDRQLRRWVSNYIRSQIEMGKSWDIAESLKDFSRELFSDAFVRHEKDLTDLIGDTKGMIQFRDELQKMLKQLTADLVNEAENLHAQVMKLDPNGGNDETAAYKAAFGGHGKQWYYPYVESLRDGDFNKEASNSILNYCQGNGALSAALSKLEALRAASQVPANSLRLCLSNINLLFLLGDIAKEINNINAEEEHFMLAKTPILFERLIGDSDAPFVMERAGEKFENVMIDEFQDTSPLQWRNFEKLLINNTAQGKECLLVGDSKQGIYRFRGGDWKQLNTLAALPDVHKVPLDTNHRSTDTIIDFNNAVFTHAAQAQDTPWPTDAHQEKNHRAGGYVRVCLNHEDKYEDIAQQIYKLIETQHIQLSDIAVLVRYNRNAKGLIEHFRVHHPDLQLVSNEAFLLQSSRAVQRLMAAVRYLRDIDREDMYRDHISEEFLKRSGGIPQDFIDQRHMLKHLTLYTLCERIVDLFALDQDQNEAPFLFHFFDEILEYLGEHTTSLEEFVKYWDDTLCNKSIPGGEVNSIRIFSIHKSKGLDFHTVIMPQCEWDMEEDSRGDILWCETHDGVFDYLPVLPISITKEMGKSIFANEYNEDHEAQRIENLNLLYVAFTRAKQNLLVWGDAKEDDVGDSCSLLLTTLRAMSNTLSPTTQEDIAVDDKHTTHILTYGTPELQPSRKGAQTSTYNPLRYKVEEASSTFYHSNTTPTFRQSGKAQDIIKAHEELLADSDADRLSQAKQKAYIQEGILLHEAFSRIVTVDDIAPALASMQREGLVDEAWVTKHHGFILSRISSGKTRDWFSHHWTAFNEQSIICPHHERPMFTTRRPDRVITDGTRTIVIDFKFARHNADHANQVEQYCTLLREMGFPGVEGYLWYVYNNEIFKI